MAVNPDSTITHQERNDIREQWTWRLLIAAVGLLLITGILAFAIAQMRGDPNHSCPGIASLRPGQTVTLSCAALPEGRTP